jgi:hypothetical protein
MGQLYDGALTKENYIEGVRKVRFANNEILDEKQYMELDGDKDKEKRQIRVFPSRLLE